MREFMSIVKALADESRVRTVMALRDGDLCVCQIIELLGLAPSTVSKHMAILKQARLVESRKDGRWIYYRLADATAPSLVQDALAWVQESLSGDARIDDDAKTLKNILCTEREELSKHQYKQQNHLRKPVHPVR